MWRLIVGLALLAGHVAAAAEWHVAPSGSPAGQGTQASPLDLASTLGGQRGVAAGDTVWLAGGTYKHPNRQLGSPGYEVRLAGQADRPIVVRGQRGERVTIDGGLTVHPPSTHLHIRDLEILVSENFTMPRRVEEPGSHPQSYGRPWGGLNVQAGEDCKYINLVIHDNAQGVSFWKSATNSELHGCLIYDNGWDAPDRGHGHAIYTQNEAGVKTISDCIMTCGHSYTMHAYGSSRAYVDNYLIQGNIAYQGGTFLIGGGRPSRGIRVLENYLYGVPLQLGYSAPHNEDCVVRDNMIVGAGLAINKFRQVDQADNLVLGPSQPRPDEPARVIIRPNRYDPQRAHVAIFNWKKQPEVDLPVAPLLKPGDRWRLLRPDDFFGSPQAEGRVEGPSIRVPVAGEFAAYVLMFGP